MAAPPDLAGMTATGKSARAPGFDVHEFVSDAGLKHQALVVHEAWRQHPSLGPDLNGRLPFMEQPEVGGLARLVTLDADQAAFVYPTGTVWSVSEVVKYFADTGGSAGVKAGLELCYLVAESLVEAAEKGFAQGVFGHGNVNPWTLALKQDGQPVVLGYGIPQVELLSWRENPKIQLTEDSFRYAPPERVEGGGEDVSSDLLSLALVSLEVMTGRPVYDGVVADVRQQAMRGEGVRRLYQWREKLPQNVREVMSRALKADPDTRFPSGMGFVHAVHDLLGSIDVEGPSLVEVMARVRAAERRGRAAGRTGALTPAQLAEAAADLESYEDRPLPPPRRSKEEVAVAETPVERPRWGKVQRSSSAATPAPAPEADRPRRRLRGDGPATSTINTSTLGASTGATRPQAASTGMDDARERLRRRLRESAPQVAPAPSSGAPIPDTGQVLGTAIEDRPVPAEIGPDSGEVDLTAPDDVQLEPLTGKPPSPEDEEPVLEIVPPRADTGRVLANARAAQTPAPAASRAPHPAPAAPPPPAPPPPAPPSPAPAPVEARAAAEPEGAPSSAAAALLERLRTSGGRRRRSVGEPSLPVDPPTSPVSRPPAPAAPVAAAPVAAAPVAAAPVAAAPVAAAPVGVEVVVGDARLVVDSAPARHIAARVVAELALPTVDLTGRFAGVWRLYRGDVALAPAAVVTPGPGLHLRRVRTGVRPVRLQLPDGRGLELPIETGLPARWILVGLAEWGLLPDPHGTVNVGGRDLDPAESLAEAFEAAGEELSATPLVSVRPVRVS